jgi:deoxyadenosine/deoxycytidine kinase
VDFRYLAIEGPVGVGKSTLAERLASRLDARAVLDDRENPFLVDFYSGRNGAAFQTQLFFTLARHRQLSSLRQRELFNQTTVCDYIFERDRIYAFVNLDDNELFIYQRLFELLVRDLPPPDVVIYLQTPTDALRRQLRDRERRASEQLLIPDDQYLA